MNRVLRYQPEGRGRERVMLYCLRHAQAGTELVWQHQAEEIKKRGLPLTRLGQMQAQAAAAFLKDFRFDYIYTSDLLRAAQTADYVKEHHPQTLFNSMMDLREIHAADVDDNENNVHLVEEQRRLQAFAEMLRSFSANEQVLIISHGNYLNQLLAALAACNCEPGIQFSFYNASLSCALIDEQETMRVTSINNTEYLDSSMLTMT